MSKPTETVAATGNERGPNRRRSIENAVTEPDLKPGDDIGQFRLRRLLGEGGMGQVYLARDLELGRSVAVKLIRPERFGPAGVARFLKEARTTARFNHPHIVTIYAVGKHGERPYLALEYLDGESLRERLLRERLSVDEVLHIGRALADALAHAHAQGVLHCDLKPSNVMIAKDGRVRVVDFGIAADLVEDTENEISGTAKYMAPEQWVGEGLTDRVDIWALGLILFECFEGAHPFDDAETRPGVRSQEEPVAMVLRAEGVPAPIARLIADSLSKDPAQRPSAVECRAMLEAALSPLPGIGAADSPFRGLLSFEDRHGQVFFGREAETAELLERLRSEPLIPVIGPSGVGKSSFVHAGLVPRLRAQAPWTVLSMRPGSTPLRTLAHKLLALGAGARPAAPMSSMDDAVLELARDIARTPSILALRLATLAAAGTNRILLIVDQLEELFTHVADPAEHAVFLSALLSAADDVSEPVRVIFTIRDDFLGRIPNLKNLFVLGPLAPEGLRRAISEPLRRVGYDFDDPRLVETMLGEVSLAPGGLPLLQFALRLLWDQRDEGRRLLLASAYEKLGGVGGALATHADQLFESLSPAEVRAARAILLRLVSPEGTRRVVEDTALLEGQGAAGSVALAKLTDARLVLRRRSRDSGDPTIELAHESLIVRWTRLALWLDEGREERVFAAELEEATKLWIRRGRRAEETWTGAALAGARARVAELHLEIGEDTREFLEVGAAREARSQTVRRRALIAGALTLILVAGAALTAAIEFRSREQEAKRQRDEMEHALANLGEVELSIEAVDWDAEQLTYRPVPASELPELSITIHHDSELAGVPGRELAPKDLRVVSLSTAAANLHVFRVEAPGIRAFLRVDHRGRAGEKCPPSWLQIQKLPGYAEKKRGEHPAWKIRVPTCRASWADSAEVAAGEMIFGGAGEPPVQDQSVVDEEKTIPVAPFRIDRAEVSNAAYSLFAGLKAISGEEPPNYPSDDHLSDAGKEDHPVTGITARTASAYCAYFGKRLPTFKEWAKTVRGGVYLPGGAVNMWPRRLNSWTGDKLPPGINFAGDEDGCAKTCSVRSRAPELNVYGVRDLQGNVMEWGSGYLEPGDNKLTPWIGGSYVSDAGDSLITSVSPNLREEKYFDFQTGFRCVMPLEVKNGPNIPDR